MSKSWLLRLIWALPALCGGVGTAGTGGPRSVNDADGSLILASSEFVASDRAAPAIDCRQSAVGHAKPEAKRGIIRATGAAPRSLEAADTAIAAYVRLHRRARTNVPYEWQPLGNCVFP